MSIKKNFLKNILTTTSTLAMIAGASSSAMGATVNTTGDNFILQSGANTNAGGNWADGNRLDYGGNHAGITGDGHIKISKIVIAGHTPGVLTVVDNAGTGASQATISQATTAGKQLNIELFDGSSLTLNGVGNSYTGIGAIDAANAGNGTVNITGALTYNGTIGTGTKVAAVAFNAAGNAVAIGGAIKSGCYYY